MLALLAISFVAGVVSTSLSPCVLPVLPVVFAGGATGSVRRSVGIVVGLCCTFGLATLFGAVVLSALGLPDDLLEYAGRVLLLVLALALLVEPVGRVLERPFQRLQATPAVGASTRSGVLLGAGLGLVFVPCAGPILATIATAAARHHVGWTVVALTAAYVLGAGLPLLVLALLSERLASTWTVLRRHARRLRQISGLVIAAMAVVIWTGALTSLQDAAANGLATSIESHLVGGTCSSTQAELNHAVGEKVDTLAGCGASTTTGHGRLAADQHGVDLPVLGNAPGFPGITAWLNTPGGKPLSLASLRGKVVLVDFWTYSCINCRRSLPHVEAWYARYHRFGFVVVGVHTPEFPFEYVVSNVRSAAAQLGVRYPIAVDDDYATWTAFNNNDWPAEYLIDQWGQVRHADVGESGYVGMERAIRALLAAGGARHLPPPTDVPNLTPTSFITPETYLGWTEYQDHASYDGFYNIVTNVDQGVTTTYTLPALSPDYVGFGGTWDVGASSALAVRSSQLGIAFEAADVYLVCSGHGTLTVRLGGHLLRTLQVRGIPNLYTLYSATSSSIGTLTVSVSPGVRAYDLTFG